ncbi:hypothetical protein DPMN_149604 [Dreissena polymorpha]|uniref:Uncharacterized protein n=1 Tax=Dreissena polymorpha TaxID=45954 RepID=A0A9D4J2K6_DREPO|nr:hypothetical protein DPMN_149604 [Dreissena polymorpha]
MSQLRQFDLAIVVDEGDVFKKPAKDVQDALQPFFKIHIIDKVDLSKAKEHIKVKRLLCFVDASNNDINWTPGWSDVLEKRVCSNILVLSNGNTEDTLPCYLGEEIQKEFDGNTLYALENIVDLTDSCLWFPKVVRFAFKTHEVNFEYSIHIDPGFEVDPLKLEILKLLDAFKVTATTNVLRSRIFITNSDTAQDGLANDHHLLLTKHHIALDDYKYPKSVHGIRNVLRLVVFVLTDCGILDYDWKHFISLVLIHHKTEDLVWRFPLSAIFAALKAPLVLCFYVLSSIHFNDMSIMLFRNYDRRPLVLTGLVGIIAVIVNFSIAWILLSNLCPNFLDKYIYH